MILLDDSLEKSVGALCLNETYLQARPKEDKLSTIKATICIPDFGLNAFVDGKLGLILELHYENDVKCPFSCTNISSIQKLLDAYHVHSIQNLAGKKVTAVYGTTSKLLAGINPCIEQSVRPAFLRRVMD